MMIEDEEKRLKAIAEAAIAHILRELVEKVGRPLRAVTYERSWDRANTFGKVRVTLFVPVRTQESRTPNPNPIVKQRDDAYEARRIAVAALYEVLGSYAEVGRRLGITTNAARRLTLKAEMERERVPQ